MRGAIIAGCIFVVMVIGMFLSLSALEKSCKEISDTAENIYQCASEQSFEEAQKMMKELEDMWDRKSKWVSMLVDHGETDEIMKTIAALGEYVKYTEMPELMAEIKTLKILIEHIPEKERPGLRNIF